jgi:UDP-N-acetylmuramoyl-tripeptide--D-alanyl-D-alanine ligase
MVARVRRVVATSGNQNNEVGVPLTLLALESDSEAAVVEMGMRGRGQIEALTAVAEPDVGIITNIHPVHLELLGTLEGVASAKAELLYGLRPGGVAVVPAGCAPLEPHLPGCKCRVLSFGVGPEVPGADVTGWLEEQGDEERAAWVLHWPEGEARIETAHLASYTLENAIAAATACYGAGLPMEDCAKGIADVSFSAGRGEIIEVGSLCLIDDTYNANPAAMQMAVDDLARLGASRKARVVAVLGDMLELGPDTERFHEEIGTYAAEAGIRVLWGVGPLSKATVEGFRKWWGATERSGKGWNTGHVDSSEDTAPVVDSLCPGDVGLFKASRGVQLEKMVSRVVAESASGRWTDGPD